MLIEFRNVAKSYGATRVFEGVSFVVNAGDRIGVVGANGVGKTTLLKIAMGEIAADAGAIERAPSAEIGYVSQVIEARAEATLDDLVRDAQRRVRALEARMRELEPALEGSPSALDEYGRVASQYDALGGYGLDHRVAEVLDGLDLARVPRDRPIGRMSGGEKTRAALAGLLISLPEVLLLDEPTNHLDARASEWLERFVAGHAGAVVAVSHDRRFLNAVATRIVEIDEHTRAARNYAGNYDAYAAAKRRERAQWEQDHAAQQEEIRALREAIRTKARRVAPNRPPTDSDKFAKGFFKGRAEGAISRRVRSAEHELERILTDPIPRPPRPLRFSPDFDPAALRSPYALTADAVRVAFDGRPVLEDASLAVRHDARLLITGDNGAGKTTLLRALIGEIAPDGGNVRASPQVRLGYLPQEDEAIDPARGRRTVLEAYREGRAGSEESLISELMMYGLFDYAELGRALGSLSAGQRRKVSLARLMAGGANVLVLDEPTNHFSLDVVEALERALAEFPGAVVAVSHDRAFQRAFLAAPGAAELRLDGGRLRPPAEVESTLAYGTLGGNWGSPQPVDPGRFPA